MDAPHRCRPQRPDGTSPENRAYLRRMTSGMKDLRVWQEAVALAAEVVRTVRQSTRRETKAFTDHMMHSAVSVASSIAHGYACYAPEEQRAAYSEARRALLDLETRVSIARQSGLLPAPAMAQLGGRLTTVSRLLAGYVAYLDRQAESAFALPSLALRAELLDDQALGAPRV